MLARSCQNKRIVVLGAQASPPARVQSSHDRELTLGSGALMQFNWLLWTQAGGDACAPSTTMRILF